jgi:transposase-like protein
VDRDGKTVDFRLSVRRDVMAAKRFFRKVLKTQGRPPRVITLDGYAASHRDVQELPEENQVWNNTNHRRHRTPPPHSQNQFDLSKLKIQTKTAPTIWNAVRAA